MIIDTSAMNYILIALGAVNIDFCKKHPTWIIPINGENHLCFPPACNDVEKIYDHLRNLFKEKTLIYIRGLIVASNIPPEFRTPIISHLSMRISHILMSREIMEIKKTVNDLNDKFNILIDVLQLNNPK